MPDTTYEDARYIASNQSCASQHGLPGELWAPPTWSHNRIRREGGGHQHLCPVCLLHVYCAQWVAPPCGALIDGTGAAE